MRVDKESDVLIVGGGCSGSLVAANLLKMAAASKRPISITLLAKERILGLGVAYGAPSLSHVLNVPSQAMSAYVEEPDHLLRWLTARGRDADPLGFIPRQWYGQYLSELVDDAEKEAVRQNPSLSFEVVHQEAIELASRANGWLVATGAGQTFSAKQVVLASGLYFHPNDRRLIRNPWRGFDPASFSKESSVALVGSGLSAVDMLLWLSDLDWKGPIAVFAKNGQMPLAHNRMSFAKKVTYDWSADWDRLQSLACLFGLARTRLSGTKLQGAPWQSLIDSFRPHTQVIWGKMDTHTRKRFLRHLQGIWDVHRHRIAPEVASRIQTLQERGFFQIKKALVTGIDQTEAKVVLRYKVLKEAPKEAESHLDLVISCMGLETNYGRVEAPLIASSLKKGLMKSGPLGKGLLALPDGHLLDALGKVQPRLFTLGFSQHGNLWESVAVPEIRSQARAIAENVLKSSVASAPEKEDHRGEGNLAL